MLMCLFCVLILFGCFCAFIYISCSCQTEIKLVKALQKQLKNSRNLVNRMEKRNQLIELQQKKLIKVLKGATKLLEEGTAESKFYWTSRERPSHTSESCPNKL